ncbi:MAG TPA: DNA polymerase Y family protein [Myxococcales bacterium]|jgi:protein ImuB
MAQTPCSERRDPNGTQAGRACARAAGASPRVVGVYLPRFLVQRRLREDGSLAHKPVAVVRTTERGEQVVAASRLALVAGVALGATGTEARAACPGLRLLPDDPAADLRALEGLAEALLAGSPAVELCGPQALCADASAAPLFGGEGGLLQVLSDRCRALGYRASLVVADGKFAALSLAEHRPRPGVVTGPVARALAPLPLGALPAPEPLLWAWSAMGLKTLGELAALPAAGVAARFGSEGVLMQRLSQGDDPRPLLPLRPAPPLVESLGLEWPSETLEPVLFALKAVLDRLTARLSGRGLALTRLEVQLRLDPKGETRVELPLARPTNSSRLLLDVFRERLGDLQVQAPVVGVGVEALETGPAERVQLCVGDRPEVDEALEAVLARLRASLGERALFAARPADRHCPERAWESAPFRAGAEAGRSAPEAGRPHAEVGRPRPRRAFLARLLTRDGEPPPCGSVPLSQDPLLKAGTRPTRLLKQPQPLQVELSASGRIVAVRIGPKRHVAASVRGPERLAGEWWRGPGFARDYYRTLVAGLGGCWIFRDGQDGRFYLHGYFD